MRETSIISTLHSSAARLILEVFKILFYSLVEEKKKGRTSSVEMENGCEQMKGTGFVNG
jgi:hypothetical protein